jgi:hypothetical protein
MGEQGWDPDVKKFFRKVINTISFGLLWLMATVTAGIYFQLAWRGDKPLIYVILFYVCAIGAFLLLLRYYYKLWNK